MSSMNLSEDEVVSGKISGWAVAGDDIPRPVIYNPATKMFLKWDMGCKNN
jgi:hypothetical protein